MFRNWFEVLVGVSVVISCLGVILFFALTSKPRPLQLVEQCGPTTRVIVDLNDDPAVYRIQVAQTRDRTVRGRAIWMETFATRNERHARAICRNDCSDGNACDIYAGGSP